MTRDGRIGKRILRSSNSRSLGYTLDKVCQRAARNVVGSDKYYVADITFNGFSWKDGEFGDKGSCYRPNSSYSNGYLNFIRRYGVAAVRVYDAELHLDEPGEIARDVPVDIFSGWGRAWAIPEQPIDGTVILHNSYPKQTGVVFFGNILASMLNQYKPLKNGDAYVVLNYSYGKKGKNMYMNAQGSCAIVTPKSIWRDVPQHYAIDTHLFSE
jgi:hypothetical protein